MVGLLLFRATDEEVLGLRTAEDSAAFFAREFPGLSPLIDGGDVASFASKSVSRLPTFQYAGPQLHHGRAVLLGDSIHTVKPYFGLGVNAAFEDVAILGDQLDAHQASVVRRFAAGVLV